MTSSVPSNTSSWGSLRYRTIDLLVVVLMGVAAGVAFRAFAAFLGLLHPAFALFPPSEGIVAGVWPIPAALAMLIVRKPGSAAATMLIGAVIEASLGSQFGVTALLSGLLVASGFEVAGLLSHYRRPSTAQLIIGAEVSMVAQWIWEQFIFWPEWAWPFRIAHLVLFLMSGPIVLAFITPKLADALARTGALSAFPLGREQKSRD